MFVLQVVPTYLLRVRNVPPRRIRFAISSNSYYSNQNVMKLMKNWIKTMLFVSVLCLAACSDDPDVAPLKRDTDAVELAYNSGATTQISVRYAGSWSARVECTDGSGTPVNNWFSYLPGQWCRQWPRLPVGDRYGRA